MPKTATAHSVLGNNIGADLTPEQVAFALAMCALKHRLGRHPTWREVLAESRRLGYSKTGEKEKV